MTQPFIEPELEDRLSYLPIGGRLMSWFLAWLLLNVLFGVWCLWVASRPIKNEVSRGEMA